MGRKVKVIKDTTLIPVDVSGKSEIKAKTGCQTTDTFLNAKIDQEISRATGVEADLQRQIRELEDAGFSVTDVVATYSDLMAYDKSLLIERDVIIVLSDENIGGGVSSMYRWDGTQFISLGASSYTVNQIDTLFEDVHNRLDYLEDKSSLRDVVISYSDLEAYDKSWLVDGDIVAVLQDDTHNNASTYYKYDGVSAFYFIGGLGPNYYNKDEIDAKLAEVYGILNNHELRITENRNDIDARMSYEDTEEILHGEGE